MSISSDTQLEHWNLSTTLYRRDGEVHFLSSKHFVIKAFSKHAILLNVFANATDNSQVLSSIFLNLRSLVNILSICKKFICFVNCFRTTSRFTTQLELAEYKTQFTSKFKKIHTSIIKQVSKFYTSSLSLIFKYVM